MPPSTANWPIYTLRQREFLFAEPIVAHSLLFSYVDGLDSVDDLQKYSTSQFMCLIEEKKPNNPTMVSIAMISICTSTGDVVWDEFDGEWR